MRYLLLFTAVLFCSVSYADDVSARLDWSERVEMSTLVSGVVETVNVHTGQQVKKGDVLLVLNQQAFKAALEKAKAESDSAELAKQEAEKEWERAQELYDRTVLSDHELATAKVLNAKGHADYQLAQAKLAQAKINLQYSQVTAPFDGVVVQVNAARGQTVVTGLQSVPLIAMANNQPMLAVSRISSGKIARLSHGSRVKVKAAGVTYAAKIHSLGVEADKDNDFEIAVSFDTKGSLFRRGEKAEIVLP